MSRFVLYLVVAVALLGVGWQADAGPLKVAVVSELTGRGDPVASYLDTALQTDFAGSTVHQYSSINDLAAAMNYSAFDTIVLMHGTSIASNPSDGSSTTLSQAVLANNVRVVTEHGGGGLSPTSPTRQAIANLGLTPGTTVSPNFGGTGFFGGADLDFVEDSAPGTIGENVPDPYSEEGNRNFLQYGGLGPGATLVGDAGNAGTGFNNLGGIIVDGAAYLIGYEWGRNFGSGNPDTQQLILNAVAQNQPMGPGPGPGPGVIPEPSTLALFSIAILGVLGYGWRRRNQGDASNVDNAA